MDIAQKITQTVEPSLEALGYQLVLVRMADGARRKTLTIMAERADGNPMGFDDCTEISRTVGALLEVEDPITGAYDLEVCSPGLDRPLTRLADFERYKDFEAKIETLLPQAAGRKRFRGMLKGVKGDEIMLDMPEGEVAIAFDHIRTAKLVMTDALVEAQLKQQKQHKQHTKKAKG